MTRYISMELFAYSNSHTLFNQLVFQEVLNHEKSRFSDPLLLHTVLFGDQCAGDRSAESNPRNSGRSLYGRYVHNRRA